MALVNCKIKRLMWIVHITIILCFVKRVFCCSRVPEGTHAEKSPSDGRYVIKVSGAADKYEPGQKYSISLMGIQGVSSPAHTFKGFFLTVQSDNGDPLGGIDTVGSMELLDTDTTKFSAKCPHLVTHTNALPKTKVQVEWTAPGPGSGCVFIRATVIEHRDVWYMDDGFLTKQLCEVQQDDIDNQPEILEKCCACDEAKYELIFEGKWSRHTHPKDFPADNWRTGFSDIIGASHTIDYRFWRYGEKASEGLKEVAEHGSTRKLEGELKEESDQIRTIIKARGLSHPNVTGKTFAVFRVDSRHHLISLVSMIQPSPDWIVGVSGLELCLSNCSWVEYKLHNLYPWDAGTDGGPSYLSSDQPEKAQDVIRRIKSNYPNDPRSPFFDPTGTPMKPLARLHITRRRLYQKSCDNVPNENDPMECTTHPWSKWSECSSKCGPGKRFRTRQFKNPLIANQFDCKNQLRDEEECVGRKCRDEENDAEDLDCRLSEWSEWSGCSTACGRGTRTRSRQYLSRKNQKKCQGKRRQVLQDNEECEGTNCTGDITEEPEIAEECDVTGWSDWTPCSVRCGVGVHSRQREVWNKNKNRNENDPDPCADVKTFEEASCTDSNCNTRPDYCNDEPTVGTCRDNKVTSFWYYDPKRMTCALFFDGGCNKDENKFNSRKECLETCEERPEFNSMTIENLRREGYYEKVDCKVSEWKVRPCNVTCGEGHQIKIRDVLRSPRYGGKPCPKKMVKIEKCNIRCPNEFGDYRRKPPVSMSHTLENMNEIEEKCRYSEWTAWTPCTATCGDNSFRQKTRLLLNSELSHKCMNRVRVEKCNVLPCYNDCRKIPCN